MHIRWLFGVSLHIYTYFGWIRGNERELLNWAQCTADGYHTDASTELMQYEFESLCSECGADDKHKRLTREIMEIFAL